MTTMTQGTVSPGFGGVSDAFEQILRDDPTGGAAVSVYVGGECVADLWGGVADPGHRTAWHRSTPALVFSCTKGLLATCVIAAAQDGRLSLDAPIASFWPAFGRNGKADITTRMVLAHTAGLSALDTGFTVQALYDPAGILRALEDQRPLWPPGAGHAYHAMTYGWLVAEILRRATGESLRDHFARLFGGPGSRTWLGRPATFADPVAVASWDRNHATLEFPPDEPGVAWTLRASTRAVTMGGALDPELVGPGTGLNDPVLQAAGIPAVGVISTARSLARCWSSTIVETAGNGPILDAHAIADAVTLQADGPSVLGMPGPWPRWSSGYMLDSEFSPMLGPESFGHDGAGGQLTFADTQHGVGFAFVTNRLRNRDDRRATSLVEAVRSAVSARESGAQAAPSSHAARG